MDGELPDVNDDVIHKNYEKKVGERKRICYVRFKDKNGVSDSEE
jgi:hypothetical protein